MTELATAQPRERAAYALAGLAATRPEFLDDLCRCLADETLGYWAGLGIAALEAPSRGIMESIAEWGMSTEPQQQRAALRSYLVLPGQARAWVIGRGLDDPATRTLALRVMLALSTKAPDIATLFRRSATHPDALVRNVVAVETGQLDPASSIDAAIAFTTLVPDGLPEDAYRGTAQVVHPTRQLAATWDGEVLVFRLPSRSVVWRRPGAPPAHLGFDGDVLVIDGERIAL